MNKYNINVNHFSKHYRMTGNLKSLTLVNKFSKYSNEYHGCYVEIYIVSNSIKYDMQTYANAILNKLCYIVIMNIIRNAQYSHCFSIDISYLL